MKKILMFLFIFSSTQSFSLNCSNELDEYFNSLPSWLSGKSDSLVSRKCVEISMNIFGSWAQALGIDENGKRGVFIYCEEGKMKRSSLPQCQTESYMNTTLNTYNSVSDCLGLNIRNLYPIIATESGFYHNSISLSSMDFGWGQVTAPAIGDVNLSWDYFVDEMKGSNKQSCKNLISFMEERDLQPVEEDFDCNLTSAPKNPVLNALYTGFHYRLVSSYMENYARSESFRARIENFLRENFTMERYEKIKSILVILSYNLGFDGAMMAIEEFLLEKEFEIEQLISEREEISTSLAQVNIKLMETDSRDLRRQKLSLLVSLTKMDQEISKRRNPKLFSGEEIKNSFGSYLVEKGISRYLKTLLRRLNYVAQKDHGNLCQFQDVFQVL